MKHEYVAPDCELIRFKLKKDILGDSKAEPSDNPIISGGGTGDPDDPFANG